MNLDELRSVHSAERQSDALQHLRDGFYQDAGEYVGNLREQRRAAAADAADPYGDEEVRRLTDEIETAKAVTETIWEARIGKLLREASLAATDMSAGPEGLTPEEAALFERVVDAIETNRETIQEALEGAESVPDRPDHRTPRDTEGSEDSTATDDGSRPPPDGSGGSAAPAQGRPDSDSVTIPEGPPDSTPTADGPVGDSTSTPENPPVDGDGNASSGESSADPPDGGGSDPQTERGEGTEGVTPTDAGSETASPDETDRVRVRITEDVGTIAGVDGREYHLATDDVAELPDANARPLIERNAAEALE